MPLADATSAFSLEIVGSFFSSWQEAEEGTYAIVGRAETVRETPPHDLTMRSMERFARDVMPALRAEFP